MLRSHGRKSQHSAMLSGVIDVNWPPEPPNNINAAAQSVWRETIANLSADVLPKECYSLFGVWCSPKIELDEVMLTLAQFPSVPTRSEDLKRYKALIRMRSALTREFGQLSSRLRLTPAARLDAHRPQSGVSNKPWSVSNKPSASANEQEDQQPREFSQRSSNGTPWGESAVEVASEPWGESEVEVAGEEEQP
jgi:phage terminase small subunit